MLQLLTLEAYGFKSFADKLHIEFGQGVTAIVGPNGSGKSNITDAIRWVLGEQNVRNLRGIKAEDVIFSGSSERRRLGAAEVSLVFDNTGGELPLEFQEVKVTRRIFRSGVSEYYINRTQCRLKDVHALFADTGLGQSSMSVIGQNRVDYVLNSKPEERRTLFEEVAGITKYRDRKRESLRKLEDTEKNLVRVGDIIYEIKSGLDRLAANAAKTRRYNALMEKYRQVKLSLLVNQYEQIDDLLEKSRRQQKALQQEVAAGDARLQNTEVTRTRLNSELAEIETSLHLLTVKIRQFSGELEKNRNRLAVLHERLHQGEITKARLTASLVELTAKCRQDALQLAANEKRRAKIADALRASQLQVEQKDGALSALDAKIGKMEAELASCREKRLENMQRSLEMKSDLQADAAELDALRQLEEENAAAIGRLKEETAGLAASLALKEKACEENVAKRSELTAKTRRLDREARDIATKERQRTEEKNSAYQKLQTVRNKVNFLQSLQAEYEGMGRAVRSVLKAAASWRGGVCGVVAELIQVPHAYLTAIEVALGAGMQNIVTKDEATAKQAIAYLKQNRLGRATFLPLTAIRPPAARTDDSRIEKKRGFVGYAASLVSCDSAHRAAIDFLLRRTIVVRNLDDAAELARETQYKIRVVTLDGDVVNAGGSFTGGSRAKRQASFFERTGELEDLQRMAGTLEEKLAACQADEDALAGVGTLLRSKLEAEQMKQKELNIEAAENRLRLEQAQRELDQKRREEAQLAEKTLRLAEKKAAVAAKFDQAKAALSALEDGTQTEKAQDAELRLASARRERSVLQASLTEWKIKHSALCQKQSYLQEKDDADKRTASERDAQKKQIEKELAQSRSQQAEYEREAGSLEAENKRLGDLKAISEKDYTNFQSVRLNKQSDIQRQENLLQELRRSGRQMRGALHQKELDDAKYTVMLEQCAAALASDYQISVEQAREKREDGDDALLSEESKKIEKELHQIGSVNPDAIQEYEAASDRYRFLTEQADDLTKSKAYLEGLIEEINVTMAKQFKASFACVKEYFQKIFLKLFGGGEAQLKLTDENGVLEAGIEIFVRPPGKKMNGLSALSGGERALTVIALLFSFLRYRPAPFIVVDEIDAPLDEANVERFGNFLREYAANTQFIVVTHRKNTMQAADVLYGVTSTTGGVSRIVSVKLEDM